MAFGLSAKTLLEKDKNRDAFYEWDKVDKALGSRSPCGTSRSKTCPRDIGLYGHREALGSPQSGTRAIPDGKDPALLKEEKLISSSARCPWAAMRSEGIANIPGQHRGLQLVAKHDGKETIKITSTAAFEKLLPKAKPAAKK